MIKMTVATFTEAVVSEGDIGGSPCMRDGACKINSKVDVHQSLLICIRHSDNDQVLCIDWTKVTLDHSVPKANQLSFIKSIFVSIQV